MKYFNWLTWSFFIFVVISGCGANMQAASRNQTLTADSSLKNQNQIVETKASDNESKKDVALVEKRDDSGYLIKPLDIEMKAGKPYMPVGAELISRQGKVPFQQVMEKLAELKGYSVSYSDDIFAEVITAAPVAGGGTPEKKSEAAQTSVFVNIRPEDNYWDALENVLRQLDYNYEVRENTIIISYKETRRYHIAMPQMEEAFSSSIGGSMLSGDSKGLKSETSLTLKAANINFWTNLEASLKEIVQCRSCPAPVIDKALGIITISAPKRVHENVKEYLDSLKNEVYKQVVIESKILEIRLTEEHNTGVDWSNFLKRREFKGGITFGQPDGTTSTSGLLYNNDTQWVANFVKDFTLQPQSWNMFISALGEFGDIQTLSNPKVTILNGHGAVLSVGEETVYLSGCSTTTSDTGVITSASPVTDRITEGLNIGIKANILNDDEVIIYVVPVVTRLIQLRSISDTACGQIQAPETSVREMATFAKVKNGEMLMIGGLIQKREERDDNKVPYLSETPILGKLFQHDQKIKNRLELVILIKPIIISSMGYYVDK